MATGPNSSDSSPAARRRIRSIWKKRSWACRKPVARATSRRSCPETRGTPRASRSIFTEARRPATARRPSSWGRLATTRDRAQSAATRTTTAAPASTRTAMRAARRTSGHLSGDLVEDGEHVVHVLLGVLHRDRPLLVVALGLGDDPSVQVHVPVAPEGVEV